MEIDELQAGRELDALVAEKVMGWHNITRWADGEISGRHKQADHQLIELPHYSTDIATAWEVIKELCGAWDKNLQFRAEVTPSKERIYAKFFDYKTQQVYGASDETNVALAICKAALRAVGCSVS